MPRKKKFPVCAYLLYKTLAEDSFLHWDWAKSLVADRLVQAEQDARLAAEQEALRVRLAAEQEALRARLKAEARAEILAEQAAAANPAGMEDL